MSELNSTHFPLEVWRYIGEFVDPLSIYTFSLICRSSYYVTIETKFWLNLLNNVNNSRFKDFIPIPRGLRAQVIRYLCCFNQRLRSLCLKQSYLTTFDTLLYSQCIGFWSDRRISPDFYSSDFYFKFTIPIDRDVSFPVIAKSGIHRLYRNSEKNNLMLLIENATFTNLPKLKGLVMQNIDLRAHEDCGYLNRVKILFTDPITDKEYETVIYASSGGPFICSCFGHLRIRILNWWHPHYKHPHYAEMRRRRASRSENF